MHLSFGLSKQNFLVRNFYEAFLARLCVRLPMYVSMRARVRVPTCGCLLGIGLEWEQITSLTGVPARMRSWVWVGRGGGGK